MIIFRVARPSLHIYITARPKSIFNASVDWREIFSRYYRLLLGHLQPWLCFLHWSGSTRAQSQNFSVLVFFFPKYLLPPPPSTFVFVRPIYIGVRRVYFISPDQLLFFSSALAGFAPLTTLIFIQVTAMVYTTLAFENARQSIFTYLYVLSLNRFIYVWIKTGKMIRVSLFPLTDMLRKFMGTFSTLLPKKNEIARCLIECHVCINTIFFNNWRNKIVLIKDKYDEKLW